MIPKTENDIPEQQQKNNSLNGIEETYTTSNV